MGVWVAAWLVVSAASALSLRREPLVSSISTRFSGHERGMRARIIDRRRAFVASGGASRTEEDEMRASIFKTCLTVATACCFGLALGFLKSRQASLEFFAGYLVEQSLSVDNLFVFILLFEYFKVPTSLQERALRWGIIGAVLMRGIMISLGVAAVRRFRSVTLIFAAILLASSIKLLLEGDEDAELSADNAIVRIARRCFDAVDYFDGDRFFTKRNNKVVATPLFLCVICIELSDFVFAVDSIPAVLAVSKDPFVVYASNVFAIAALRSLYAVLAVALGHLPYLRPAVAVILGFVGLKMFLDYFHIKLPTAASLAVIVCTLATGVVASLLVKPKDQS